MFQIAMSILISWALLGLSSFLFFQLRRNHGLTYGFGTELFAALFAVDCAVLLGVVDPRCALVVEISDRLVTLLALLLAIGTLVLSLVFLRLEARSQAAWVAMGPDLDILQRSAYLLREWVGPTLQAWFVRMVVSTSHLIFIIRVPKWLM